MAAAERGEDTAPKHEGPAILTDTEARNLRKGVRAFGRDVGIVDQHTYTILKLRTELGLWVSVRRALPDTPLVHLELLKKRKDAGRGFVVL